MFHNIEMAAKKVVWEDREDDLHNFGSKGIYTVSQEYWNYILVQMVAMQSIWSVEVEK